jgi:RimJ/RimL family protein N-acetyltransferase
MLFTEIGRNLLVSLKATAGMPGPAVMIPVGSPPIAFLRPAATTKDLLNPEDVKCLTDWRNRFVNSFLTEFDATEERTAQWLVEVVGTSDRKILFMVDNQDGQTFGYMGLDYINWEEAYGEADAIVRGGKAPAGVMKSALLTLLSWAEGQLGLRTLGVRVRSDNSALVFYERVGFREIRRVSLRKTEESEMIRWVDDESLVDAKLYLVHMVWQGKQDA